jgi:hypothetical protein
VAIIIIFISKNGEKIHTITNFSCFFSFLEKQFAKLLNFATKQNTAPENLLKIIQTTEFYFIQTPFFSRGKEMDGRESAKKKSSIRPLEEDADHRLFCSALRSIILIGLSFCACNPKCRSCALVPSGTKILFSLCVYVSLCLSVCHRLVSANLGTQVCRDTGSSRDGHGASSARVQGATAMLQQ